MSKKENKIIASTTYHGVEMKVFSDLSLSCRNIKESIFSTFDKDYMSKLSKDYRNQNRLYKPIPLLFWQDVKNGNTKEWK